MHTANTDIIALKNYFLRFYHLNSLERVFFSRFETTIFGTELLSLSGEGIFLVRSEVFTAVNKMTSFWVLAANVKKKRTVPIFSAESHQHLSYVVELSAQKMTFIASSVQISRSKFVPISDSAHVVCPNVPPSASSLASSLSVIYFKYLCLPPPPLKRRAEHVSTLFLTHSMTGLDHILLDFITVDWR